MTAVEWLEKEIFRSYKFLLQKVDCTRLEKLIEQSKEMEKKQSIEDMQIAWKSSEQNVRFQYNNKNFKHITFEQWLEVYKEI